MRIYLADHANVIFGPERTITWSELRRPDPLSGRSDIKRVDPFPFEKCETRSANPASSA